MVHHKRKSSGAKPPGSPLTTSSMIASLIRGTLLFSVSFSINVLNAIVYLTIRPWSRLTARRVIGGLCQSLWQKAVAAILPSADLAITGDCAVDLKRPAIIIANHQVDADWWFIWEFARLYKLHSRLKIILKADLRNVPVIGWGMRQFEFLFLHRNWQSDKQSLYNLLGSFAEDGFPCALLIFPEGTTINTRTLDKCRHFATERQRPVLQHLLLPRTTGFAACVDALSYTGLRPVIYDLTVAYNGYSGEVPTWEMGYDRKVDMEVPTVSGLLRGHSCSKVHIHVKRFDKVDDVLENPEGWLDARWKEKDGLLQRFIETQTFQEADAHGETPSQRVVRPRGSVFYVLFLLSLPSMLLLSLPLLFLLGLFASPAIILAGTLNFMREALTGSKWEGGRRHRPYTGPGRHTKESRRSPLQPAN